MYKLKIKNSVTGAELDLSKPCFVGLEIKGLDAISMNVFMTNYTGFDGSFYTGSKLDSRTLEIGFYIDNDVEIMRKEILSSVGTKDLMNIFIENEIDNVDVMLDGYVESVIFDRYTSKQYVTIIVICPDPYFYDENKTIKEFFYDEIEEKYICLEPLKPDDNVLDNQDRLKDTIVNKSDGNIPVEIQFDLKSNWQTICVYVNDMIFCVDSKDSLEKGELNISSKKGEKHVLLTNKSGTILNLLNCINGICGDAKVSWPELNPGTNNVSFTIKPKTTNAEITMSYRNKYRGI